VRDADRSSPLPSWIKPRRDREGWRVRGPRCPTRSAVEKRRVGDDC
jgi:hypothetical protein